MAHERVLEVDQSESELLIVDPYLFTTARDRGYIARRLGIIDTVAPSISTLHVVTNRRNDNTSVITAFVHHFFTAHPSISVTRTHSLNIHDRYWIADQLRGIFVGTSLNGLGRKYCVVDRLFDPDVSEIVNALKAEGVL